MRPRSLVRWTLPALSLIVGALAMHLASAAPRQKKLPTPTEAPQAAEAPVIESAGVSAVGVTSTSLVGPDSDAARRWITPVLPKSDVEAARISSTISVINPDTRASARVRMVCHERRGGMVGAVDITIKPMEWEMLHPTGTLGTWCRIDTSVPTIAYATVIFSGPGRVVEDRQHVRFFKALP